MSWLPNSVAATVFPPADLLISRWSDGAGDSRVMRRRQLTGRFWRLLDAAKVNPYWGELEHYHNFSRARLYALLKECGFEPIHYTISERYRVCMEVIARRR